MHPQRLQHFGVEQQIAVALDNENSVEILDFTFIRRFVSAEFYVCFDGRLNVFFGVRRELLLMQIKQNSFSKSRILFTLGVASDSS
jgi:hypothetical protein